MVRSKDEKWDEIEDASLDFLKRFLRTDDNEDGDREKARIAAATISSATRRQATINARATLEFAMARSITDDPEQLREYIRLTTPGQKLLTTANAGDH